MVNHTHYCKKVNCRILFCKEKREKDKRRETQILLNRRYNEIYRYQASKRDSVIEEIKVQPEGSQSIVSFEELRRVAKQFILKYKKEWNTYFYNFLECNPAYNAARELYIQTKEQDEYKQLEGKGTYEFQNSRGITNLPVDQNIKPFIKPEPIVKERSSYFVKSVDHTENFLSHYKHKPVPQPVTLSEVKTEPKEVVTQNQKTVKKRVQISNQN